MVVDMTAKKNAREARLSVKREAIAAGKGESSVEENTKTPKEVVTAKK
jgi:hypothetical protein